MVSCSDLKVIENIWLKDYNCKIGSSTKTLEVLETVLKEAWLMCATTANCKILFRNVLMQFLKMVALELNTEIYYWWFYFFTC